MERRRSDEQTLALELGCPGEHVGIHQESNTIHRDQRQASQDSCPPGTGVEPVEAPQHGEMMNEWEPLGPYSSAVDLCNPELRRSCVNSPPTRTSRLTWRAMQSLGITTTQVHMKSQGPWTPRHQQLQLQQQGRPDSLTHPQDKGWNDRTEECTDCSLHLHCTSVYEASWPGTLAWPPQSHLSSLAARSSALPWDGVPSGSRQVRHFAALQLLPLLPSDSGGRKVVKD